MAIMALDLIITVRTDTDTGMGTGHIGGAGTTEDITDAGTTGVVIMVGDITVAGTPADMGAATDAIEPQLQILAAVLRSKSLARKNHPDRGATS